MREIRSDQGTNIIGAQNELKKALGELDHSAIQRSICRDFKANWVTQWMQNPPAVSHMGGAWERHIWSIQSIVSGLVQEYGHTVDETFRMLLAEVEYIINSCPLPSERDGNVFSTFLMSSGQDGEKSMSIDYSKE